MLFDLSKIYDIEFSVMLCDFSVDVILILMWVVNFIDIEGDFFSDLFIIVWENCQLFVMGLVWVDVVMFDMLFLLQLVLNLIFCV